MSDRELLVLAAKAYELKKADMIDSKGRHLFYDQSDRDCETYSVWDPLSDDGDALRLAVKLQIDVQQDEKEVTAWYLTRHRDAYSLFECASSDRLNSTRRAIVRAAAAIGRTIP